MIELPTKYSRVCAAVDLDAIRQNMNNIRNNLKPETKTLAVIKTNGYGHGAIPIANELEDLDYLYGFATATAEEAFSLRDAGIRKPILILGYTFPYAYERLITEEIRLALFRLDMAHELSECAQKLGKTVKVHIKVDTGMSRIGIPCNETGLSFIKQVSQLPGIEIEGIFTHFAKADEYDKSNALKQFQMFRVFTQQISDELDIQIPIRHCANSAASMEILDTQMDMVRVGISLYGLMPSDEVSKDVVILKPALRLESKIVYVKTLPGNTPVSYGGTYTTSKETKIATIPVGYGDGYPRSLSNKGYVLIRGQKAPICGRVCMDQMMVDVTDIENVKEGDIVTLIGTDGIASISMEELGDISGRFNYELACDINPRVPRVYIKNHKIFE